MISVEQQWGAERREGRVREGKPREVLALKEHTNPSLRTCVVMVTLHC